MPSEVEASANRCKNAVAKIEALLLHVAPETCKGILPRKGLLDESQVFEVFVVLFELRVHNTNDRERLSQRHGTEDKG